MSQFFPSKMIAFGILVIIGVSCDGEICESFDFKRIPYSSSYYQLQLKYTNGVDTVNLFPSYIYSSKESRLNPMSNPECTPYYTVHYSSKKYDELDIIYSFDYLPEEKGIMFGVLVNSSELKIQANDSVLKGNKLVFDNLNHLNTDDSTLMIKKVVIDKMRLTEIESYSGVKWTLVE